MDVDEDLVMVDSDIPLPLQAPLTSSPSSPRENRGARATRQGPPQPKHSKVVKKPDLAMKPNVVVDEMFPEGAGPYMDIDEAGGSSGLLMDLAANEKSVHTDFFNQFGDLYDDEDLL